MDAKNFFDWLIDPVKNQYADFSGRTSRKAFWMFVLVNFIVSIILSVIDEALGMKVLYTLYSVLLIIPSVAIGARRLHDINKIGWWQLIGFIPLIGWIILIVWLARKGDISSNSFGQPVTIFTAVPSTPGGVTGEVHQSETSASEVENKTTPTHEETSSSEEKKG